MDVFKNPWDIDIPSPSAFQTGENDIDEETDLLKELGIEEENEDVEKTEETKETKPSEIENIDKHVDTIDKTKSPPIQENSSDSVKEFDLSDDEKNEDKLPEAPFDETDIINPFENGTGLIEDPDKKYKPEPIIRKKKYNIINLFTLINLDNTDDPNEVDVMELDFNADFGNLRISFSRIDNALEEHKLFKNEMKRITSIAVYPEDCVKIHNIKDNNTVYCIEKLIKRTNEPWELNRPQCYVTRNKNAEFIPEVKIDGIDFSYQDMIKNGWTHEKIKASEYHKLAEAYENTEPSTKEIFTINIGEYFFTITNPNDIECLMTSLKFVFNQGFVLKMQRGFLQND